MQQMMRPSIGQSASCALGDSRPAFFIQLGPLIVHTLLHTQRKGRLEIWWAGSFWKDGNWDVKIGDR